MVNSEESPCLQEAHILADSQPPTNRDYMNNTRWRPVYKSKTEKAMGHGVMMRGQGEEPSDKMVRRGGVLKQSPKGIKRCGPGDNVLERCNSKVSLQWPGSSLSKQSTEDQGADAGFFDGRSVVWTYGSWHMI